jgi:hypothetical protein
MFRSAQAAALGVLKRVRGAGGEKAVESWGLSAKTAEKTGGLVANGAGLARPKLILSVRLAPGVAVSTHELRQALGSACACDGMITVADSSSMAAGFQLPMSEHSRAAEEAGQRSAMLFATVSE